MDKLERVGPTTNALRSLAAMNADRNLLFGILAFQNNFIDRRALLAAFDTWTADKNKPLGEILVEERAISADERALLEALVGKHLDRYGGNAEQSLAAVSSLGSVRKDLEQIADPDVQASLAGAATIMPDDGAPVDPYATNPPSAGTSTSSGMRFTILRAHAKGGLGQVSVARDEELNREVAFKEIQERFADDAVSRSRFLLEAEVTGGLEHPGIVPVYGLGQYGDGRPFYAMRFIQGDSLQTVIKRFHESGVTKRDPGEKSLELRKLLGRFIDVCNAIEYAHSRRVLHRDLKPGNIMLGKYGETLVVDWGLAKPMGHRDSSASTLRSEERTLQPASASDSGHTKMGSTIGTPQYMSPEQAEGRLDLLGPATDVYSLGATLYCLLTGRAPFPDSDLWSTVEQVSKGDFRPPRTIKKDVPPALQAICLKAMALKPENRYSSARSLADDIERWIADEPVTALRETTGERLARWGRKHRAFVRAGAGTTLVAVVALFIGLEIYRRTQLQNAESLAKGFLDYYGEKYALEALARNKPAVVRALTERRLSMTDTVNKARTAILAFAADDPQLFEESLAFQSDPTDRAAMINTYATSDCDVHALTRLLEATDDIAVRSGLCAVLGTLSVDELDPSKAKQAAKLLADLFVRAPDGATHSASDWALRQWKQDVPTILPASRPPPDRRWFVNGQGMTLVEIPAGKYTMGTEETQTRFSSAEKPPHEVTMTRPFYLAVREVTVEEFERFADDAAYAAVEKRDEGWHNSFERRYSPTPHCAVTFVNWFDAVLYCNWLSAREGRQPCYERTGEKLKLRDPRGLRTRRD